MKEVRVALFGVGVIGSMVASFLLEKEGIDIVCAIDVAGGKVGKDLGKVLGIGKKLGVKVSKDVALQLTQTKPDVAIHTTSSFLRDTYSQIVSIVKHGVSVLSTCEELSYPHLTEPRLAKKLDRIARKHNVTVLGTGINPGFLMDTLVITLTAPCQKVEKVEATRVMNAATRRLPFQKKIGAGLTVEVFNQKIEQKQITGHVGLEQSIAMIASALAWKLDSIQIEPVEPVIFRRPVSSGDICVKTGNAAGLRQKAKGVMKREDVIVLDFQAYIGATEEYDSISITGVPSFKQRIQPCVHGDLGTTAMVVNMLPRVINADPGLVTMKDLPVPSAAVEDIREYVRR